MTDRPRILLTGFEPFGGESVNASWEAVAAVDPAAVVGLDLVRLMLPVRFGASFDSLEAALARDSVAAVIMVGQASGRDAVSIEARAVNQDDARTPDNAGLAPAGVPILPGGPPSFPSGLPVEAIVARLLAAGIPARRSESAGTFVCNHVFYRACALAEAWTDRPVAGFIHVPQTPVQAALRGGPCLATEAAAEALRLAVVETAAWLAGGAGTPAPPSFGRAG